jgi:hypothetical protein
MAVRAAPLEIGICRGFIASATGNQDIQYAIEQFAAHLPHGT